MSKGDPLNLRPSADPLSEMDYLDGFLDSLYTSDMPDGAWFQSQVDAITAHWPECKDAHEAFMSYLLWKNPPKEKMP